MKNKIAALNLTKEGIISNLKPDTKISEVLYFDEIDSTNNLAKKLSLSGAKHGTLIAADRQTQGRGRSGHTFESPAGTGLYMTLILRPKIEISKFQMITIADAVAVCKAIEVLGGGKLKDKPKIKWVNDVFLRGKKITGILTEAVTNFENGKIESVVTGIGINVSTRIFHGDFSAGAIFDEGDEILFGRDELCAKVADYIMDMAENLENPEIIKSYRERSMLNGKKISYIRNGEKHFAEVEGVDDFGGLEITNENGEREILRSGEVFTVREEK